MLKDFVIRYCATTAFVEWSRVACTVYIVCYSIGICYIHTVQLQQWSALHT